MKRPQISIRTLFFLITCAAIFCAGYLAGYDSGRNSRFEELIDLIHKTVYVSAQWEDNETTAR